MCVKERTPHCTNAWIPIVAPMIAAGRFVGIFPHKATAADGRTELDWDIRSDRELAVADSIVEQIVLPHGVGASGGGGLDLKRQFAAGVGSGGMLVQVRCCAIALYPAL